MLKKIFRLSYKMADEKIINAAIDLISKYFGQESAKLYKSYYKTKSKEDIIASVNELLTETVGSSTADSLVGELEKNLL